MIYFMYYSFVFLSLPLFLYTYTYSREWRLTAPNSVLFNSAIRGPKLYHTRDYTRAIRGDPENKIYASFVLNLQAFCMVQACSGSESPAGAVAVNAL